MPKGKCTMRNENVYRECMHVWNSWEWLIDDKFDGAYRAIGQAITEMTLCGSSKKEAIKLIAPLLDNMLDKWR